jgi:hypothetical protein
MTAILTKKEALEELIFLRETWENPPFEYPVFSYEIWFADFFILMLRTLPIRHSNNIAQVVKDYFEAAFEASFLRVCRILDNHKADGTGIYNLISERKFILRIEKRNYNRKVAGKCPKGLTNKPWRDYNNWLAASIMWNGFIEAHDPEYRICISQNEDVQTPIEVLLRPEYKPLWGMKQSYESAGHPFDGGELDAIDLRPHDIWLQHIRKLKTNGQYH